MSEIQIDVLRCPYCHDSLAGEALRAGCGACLAWHHRGCLAELGRCANCGAPNSQAASPQELEAAMGRVLQRTCQTQGCNSLDTVSIRGAQVCLPHAQTGPRALLVFALFFFGVAAAAWIPALAGELHRVLELIFVLVCSGGALLLGWQTTLYRREHLRLLEEAKAERAARLAAEPVPSAPAGEGQAPNRPPRLKA